MIDLEKLKTTYLDSSSVTLTWSNLFEIAKKERDTQNQLKMYAWCCALTIFKALTTKNDPKKQFEELKSFCEDIVGNPEKLKTYVSSDININKVLNLCSQVIEASTLSEPLKLKYKELRTFMGDLVNIHFPQLKTVVYISELYDLKDSVSDNSSNDNTEYIGIPGDSSNQQRLQDALLRLQGDMAIFSNYKFLENNDVENNKFDAQLLIYQKNLNDAIAYLPEQDPKIILKYTVKIFLKKFNMKESVMICRISSLIHLKLQLMVMKGVI